MSFKLKINKGNFMSKFHNGSSVTKYSSVAKDIDSEGRDRPLTKEQANADANKNRVSLAPNKPKKKTSYSEAYKKRDMKTYGNLTEAEYTAEAKRQNESYKKTGKWDAPKKQMESKSSKKVETKKVETTKTAETKKAEVTKPVEKTKDVKIKEKADEKVDQINKKSEEKVASINQRKKNRAARKAKRKSIRAARKTKRQNIRNARKGITTDAEVKDESVAAYKKK